MFEESIVLRDVLIIAGFLVASGLLWPLTRFSKKAAEGKTDKRELTLTSMLIFLFAFIGAVLIGTGVFVEDYDSLASSLFFVLCSAFFLALLGVAAIVIGVWRKKQWDERMRNIEN